MKKIKKIKNKINNLINNKKIDEISSGKRQISSNITKMGSQKGRVCVARFPL